MIYPVKIEFKDYPNGNWTDWSKYLSTAPVISRKVESDNEGEAGVIAFDKAPVSFYYSEGSPVYNAFSIDLSGKQRYLFRISAPKSDKSYVPLFEGVADFATITWPEFSSEISFDISDKLSALGSLPASKTQRGNPFDCLTLRNPGINPDNYNMFANVYCSAGSGGVYSQAGRDWGTFGCYDDEAVIVTFLNNPDDQAYSVFWGGVPVNHLTPCVNRGETLIDLDGNRYLVTESWNGTVPAAVANSIGYYVDCTHVRLTPKIPAGRIMVIAPEITNTYCSKYYNKPEGYIDIISSEPDSNGLHPLESFDALKIIGTIFNSVWPEVNIINRTGSEVFPLPADYFEKLIDEEPLGTDPLSALKTLADTMKCYIYINRSGELVIQSKDYITEYGASRRIGNSKVISKEKKYFWDKLVDGVTVNVKSWLKDNDGNYLQGCSTQTKQIPGSGAYIKPKNSITKEILTADAGDCTQVLLDSKAALEANNILNFYGMRRSASEIVLHLDDNTIEWDLLDKLTDDTSLYFYVSMDIDLFERTLTLTPVEVNGHDYDLRQVVVSSGNASSSSVNNNSSSGTGSSVIITSGVIYPEAYGVLGDGEADDSEGFKMALNAAAGKTLMLTKSSYMISGKVLKDLGGNNIRIASSINSIIYLSDTTSTRNYYSPEGSFSIKNGSVYIEGVTFRGTSTGINPGSNYLSVLQITDCASVILKDVTAANGIYSGIHIINSSSVSLNNCSVQHCGYAGLLIRGAGQVNIHGGDYSYCGHTPYVDGYGITVSGRFPYPYKIGEPRDNMNICISGVKANYNYRKGIDIHGGIGAAIVNNIIKGFGFGGIYAVNEGGESGYEKVVKDVYINGNIIENDLNWFGSLGINDVQHPIAVGAYGDVIESGGTFIVEGNIIKNAATPRLRAPIIAYLNQSGGAVKSIIIKNNVIQDFNSYYAGIMVVGIENCDVPAGIVDISDNKISGNSAAGIFISAGSTQIINNNCLCGSFTYPLSYKGICKHTGNLLNGAFLINRLSDLYDSKLRIRENMIEEVGTNSNSEISINYAGYESGLTNYRNLAVYDGKGGGVAKFLGETKLTELFGSLDVSGDVHPSAYRSNDGTYGITSTTAGLIFKDGLFTGGDVSVSWDNIVSIPSRVSGYAASCLNLRSNIIEENATDGNASIAVNYTGYNSGTTRYRDFEIYDGKGNCVAKFTGSSKLTSLSGNLDVLSGDIHGSNYRSSDGTYGATESTGGATFKNGLYTGGEITGCGGTITELTFNSPLTGGTITTSGTVGMTQAGVNSSGYLSSYDWNAFNNKVSFPGFGSLNLRSNIIEENTTNGNAEVAVNYTGYQSGNSQYRDFSIYDGKSNGIAKFTGSSKLTSLAGSLDVVYGDVHANAYRSSDGTYGASASTGGLTFKNGLYTSGTISTSGKSTTVNWRDYDTNTWTMTVSNGLVTSLKKNGTEQ